MTTQEHIDNLTSIWKEAAELFRYQEVAIETRKLSTCTAFILKTRDIYISRISLEGIFKYATENGIEYGFDFFGRGIEFFINAE